MTRRPLAWPALLLASTVAVSVVTYAHVWPSGRPLVALTFLVLCPGMAWARLLKVEPTLNTVVLAVALSLSFDTIVATALLYAHQPSVQANLGALIGITICGLLADPSLRRLLTRRPLPHREVTA
jgi:hypothetical protein